MGRKPIALIVSGFVYGAVCALSIDIALSQSADASGAIEAYRVNSFQRFIVANAYLFDDDARLSYLYAYDPATLDGAKIVTDPEIRSSQFSVLKPSGDGRTWWAEAPYIVIDFDSYPMCPKGGDKLSCMQEEGAFLATGEKHPAIPYAYLFVIKEEPAESIRAK